MRMRHINRTSFATNQPKVLIGSKFEYNVAPLSAGRPLRTTKSTTNFLRMPPEDGLISGSKTAGSNSIPSPRGTRRLTEQRAFVSQTAGR